MEQSARKLVAVAVKAHRIDHKLLFEVFLERHREEIRVMDVQLASSRLELQFRNSRCEALAEPLFGGLRFSGPMAFRCRGGNL
jgi:hypothetical protein